MRAGRLAVILVAVMAGCGSGSPRREQCVPFPVQEFDDVRGCFGQPVTADGILLCNDPSEPQGHGLFPVCVVDPDGGLYLGWVASTTKLEVTGDWKHSAILGTASTLAASDERRCAAVRAIDPPAACQ